MRNLKKLFAVVMVVAMLASIMVPALAAGFEFEEKAEMLRDLGLFQGYSATDLGLGDDMTREQALALMLRVMGLEDEVKAMTEEEVAEQMARVVDPETITPTWAKPYVAYAIKNGLTKGIDSSTLPNVKFAGQLKVTGKEFINFMLNGMGYNAAWDDVLNMAARVEMLEPGDVLKFADISALTRDHAVGIMASALTGITADGITLAEALVKAGAVDEEKMIAYGLYEPAATPTPVPVELTAEAYADTLVQVTVVFSDKVDADSAKKADNYKINGGDIKIEKAELKDDGVTVVLTLEFASADKIKNQDKFDLTIKGVKAADGTEIKETTLKDLEFFDDTIPTVVDAQVVGKDTIKVIFSEPVKAKTTEIDGETTIYKLNKADFVVNNGKLFVKEVVLQNNYTEAMVKLYSTLKEGEATIQVKSTVEDFAGFGVIGKIIALNVVKDTEAPVVIGYEDAKPNGVTLIFSEDIQFDGKNVNEWYHTNSKNIVDDVTIDGNKATLKFNTNEMPQGTAYVYVEKEAVKDYWDNKNTKQMIQIEVELDTTPPEVKEVKQGDGEDIVVVEFSEEMNKNSIEDEDNYTILDKDGEEQKKLVKTATAKDDNKKVELKLSKKISGEFTLIIKDVEDTAGNKIVEGSYEFTIVDKTPPKPADVKVYLYNPGKADQMIKIDFGEEMAVEGKYSVDDIEKYQYKDGNTWKAIKSLKEVELDVVDDGRAVEIRIPADVEGNKSFKDKDELMIGRVADAAGNYTDDLYFVKQMKVLDTVDIDSVEATARDTVKIKFADEVNFEIEDFTVVQSVYGSVYGKDYEVAEIVDIAVEKGKTVATIKLTEKLPYTWADGEVQLKIKESPETENYYGVPVKSGSENIKDKIAPELFADDNDGNDFGKGDNDPGIKDYLKIGDKDSFKFTLYFSEDVKAKNGRIDLAASDFIIRIDGTAYKAGIDFEIDSISGEEVVFEILKKEEVEVDGNKYYEVKGDLEIELVDEPGYLVDGNDNVVAKFDTIEYEDLEFTRPTTP